jgi:hypothetical protein
MPFLLSMVRYARAQAQAQRLDNASFQVGNILQPLEFLKMPSILSMRG